jgi:hypothetical protein
MPPASTVSIIDLSSVDEKFARASLLSKPALADRPLVQANIEAIELVDVSLPC